MRKLGNQLRSNQCANLVLGFGGLLWCFVLLEGHAVWRAEPVAQLVLGACHLEHTIRHL